MRKLTRENKMEKRPWMSETAWQKAKGKNAGHRHKGHSKNLEEQNLEKKCKKIRKTNKARKNA